MASPAAAPLDLLLPLDPPTPDEAGPAALQAPRQAVATPSGVGFQTAVSTPPPPRTGLWAGLGVAALVAAGVAWWFLTSSPTGPGVNAADPAARVSALPPQAAVTAAPALPQPALPVPAPVATKTTPTPAATVALASPAAMSAAPAPPALEPPVARAVEAPQRPVPAAGATQPRIEPGSKAAAAHAQGSPDKAARVKAEREARDKAAAKSATKPAVESGEQSVARLNAEQDMRKRSEDARLRSASIPAAAPAVVAAVAPLPRTVKEICAGRNLISQAICESRECGSADHRNEALCKSILVKEERRRELEH